MENEENGVEILFYGGRFIVNFMDHLLCTGYCSNIHKKVCKVCTYIWFLIVLPNKQVDIQKTKQLSNLKYFALMPKQL